jgi:hypothetical protein
MTYRKVVSTNMGRKDIKKIEIIFILPAQVFIKSRFDGVVGYHVSLTFQLGSLKVSSSSLGRIIYFCGRRRPDLFFRWGVV